MILENYILNLKKNGFVIIPNVLNNDEVSKATELFFKWKKSIPNIDKLHDQIDPHGIFKFHEIGHQQHAWFIRTRPTLINIFKKIWNTDELTVSFDGCCYIPKEFKKKDNIWTHTDQAPISKGLQCYQGFVSLTKNSERTIVLYQNSHNLHENYFKEKNINNSKNWQLIDKDYLETIKENKRVLQINPGDLVLWDSRTFHQNQYGKPCSEERLIQYVCYLPKNHIKNTISQQKKRKQYFRDLRTTSHWPYPIKVNSLQPQTYGDISKLIDYTKLNKPNLTEYNYAIENLI